ncbi:penicillin-binding protein 1A [Idiomarina xiamenensis]|uniref:Penicillin-binding protein 1A n=1 Tax=Idiomarina xiamenensis 10-D-4 TaxID=740709 RepID=K2K2F9_9GAMM|nr:PBP1A family penicillin-binding protein [Idiomarina xiamenensis]EKE80882.1 peptidoglycan synthetase [Idiomarina xiamenensis 10-D-4]
MRIFKRILLAILALGLVGILVIAGFYWAVKDDLPSVADIRDVRLQTPMQVYAKSGELISQFGEMRRIPLTLDEMPQQMIDAILATEDNRFYEHFGIDPIGVARAFFGLVTTGEIQGGGSTITMQLARNVYLSFEQRFIRKVKEAFITLRIEQELSKDEILELYLNKIAFGQRAYGVGAAAQVYYGKPLKDLTLAQIATIAGLPKAPSTLNPISNPARSKERRRVVLLRMLDEKKISREQFEEAANAPVTARYHGAQIAMSAPYLAEMVRQEMVDRFGEDEAYNGGYRVYTTVNAHMQIAAQQAVMNNLHLYDERHGYRGPVAWLWGKPKDGKKPQQQPATLALTSENQAWQPQQINDYLANQPVIGMTVPAVVTKLGEDSAQLIIKGGEQAALSFANVRWAREYLNEDRQGAAPQTIADVLQAGQHILVRKTDNGWRLAQVPEPSSALVSLNPKDGAVDAIVGGYSFALSQYNRAVQAERQVGSNIKPFLYSAAFDNGFTLASLVNDAPINQWNPGTGVAWRPKNSPDVYEGPMRLRKALAKSKNVVSVRLIRAVGVDTVAEHLQKFGLSPDAIPHNESLSLGSMSMTPMQVARGYAVLANGGHLVNPYFIERVENSDGEVIYEAQPAVACASCADDPSRVTQAPQVISEQNAFLVKQAMNSAVWGGGSWAHKTGWNGTAWRIQRSKPLINNVGRNIAGKTGTTNDVKDTWFSGFTTGIVTSVWVGFDNVERQLGHSSMHPDLDRDEQPISGGEAGAKTALPAWIDFMAEATAYTENNGFDVPPGVSSVRIDLDTGKLSKNNDYSSRFEYFLIGTEPKEFAESNSAPVVFDDEEDGSIF